jgi:hypothetical protein
MNAPDDVRNAFVELNRILLYILERQQKMRGLDGYTPEFANDVDVGFNKVTNMAMGLVDTDALRRDQALLEIIAGNGITVTDNGDGTVTIAAVVRAGYGINLDANGLALKKQAHETDVSTTYDVTGGDTVSQVSVESALNELGTKINNILAKLESAEVFASA